MTNSIAFSSDLMTLFLIEESQVVAFPLASKRGVVIGKVDDQLVAATHNGTIDKKFSKKEEFDLGSTQVQFHYSTQLRQGYLIIIDIALEKNTKNAKPYKSRLKFFNLNSENVIFKRVENKLTVTRNPKKHIGVTDPLPL